ncbi:MAG: heavy-metal-associated domain-containing protein [Clostridia bacterium]|nr:heavy-metal-associated domain-containing protein [Clostridia bacterium]MBR6641753.1 heavy-metal-associated domain-containing protein [Clostridia bacterium]
MTVTFKVEGMMCGGCENRIKNALSGIEGAVAVNASHETKTVTVEMDKDITNILKDKIEALGFDVID